MPFRILGQEKVLFTLFLFKEAFDSKNRLHTACDNPCELTTKKECLVLNLVDVVS